MKMPKKNVFIEDNKFFEGNYYDIQGPLVQTFLHHP